MVTRTRRTQNLTTDSDRDSDNDLPGPVVFDILSFFRFGLQLQLQLNSYVCVYSLHSLFFFRYRYDYNPEVRSRSRGEGEKKGRQVINLTRVIVCVYVQILLQNGDCRGVMSVAPPQQGWIVSGFFVLSPLPLLRVGEGRKWRVRTRCMRFSCLLIRM